MGLRSRYEVHYQPAKFADAIPIAQMSRDYIEYGLSWAWRPMRVARRIRDRDCVVLTARVSGQLAGFAIMQFGLQQACLMLFAVDPDFRRHGIGRGLLEWLEDTARTAGVFTVRLEVREQNIGAIRMYGKLGYREYKRVRGYYRGRETAVCLYKDLHIHV